MCKVSCSSCYLHIIIINPIVCPQAEDLAVLFRADTRSSARPGTAPTCTPRQDSAPPLGQMVICYPLMTLFQPALTKLITEYTMLLVIDRDKQNIDLQQ